MHLLDVFKLEMDNYPPIDASPEITFANQIRQINALLSHFMHIPFPEELDDDTWLEKYSQFKWLLETNRLPIQMKKE